MQLLPIKNKIKFLQLHAFLIALLSTLVFSQTAMAECQYIQAGLKNKMKSYKEFRSVNQQNLENLVKTDTHCKKSGKEITTRVATLSAAQSCEALKDISGMDKEMHDVGEECSNHFKKIETIQVAMHQAFEEAQDDLEGAMKMMEKSAILQKYCSDEIQATFEMVKGFLVLEGNIVAVENVSDDGRTNYSKMKEAAGALQNITGLSGTNCGAIATALTGAVAGMAKPVDAKATLAASGKTLSRSAVTGEEGKKSGKVGGANRGLASGQSEISGSTSDVSGKINSVPNSKTTHGGAGGARMPDSIVSSGGYPNSSLEPNGNALAKPGSLFSERSAGEGMNSLKSKPESPKVLSTSQSSIAFAIHAVRKESINGAEANTGKDNQNAGVVASITDSGKVIGEHSIKNSDQEKVGIESSEQVANQSSDAQAARVISSSNGTLFEVVNQVYKRTEIFKGDKK